MVHALEEVWRVLVAGGWMVDLRPVSTDWPLEVIIDGRPMHAGTVDGSPSLADQIASDAAIAEMMYRRWFTLEEHTLFDLVYYWSTIEEMEAYVQDTWANTAAMPEATLEDARRLVKSSATRSEIRMLRQMEIARYRRAEA